MPTITYTAADFHAVFAYTASGQRVRLTEPTTDWGKAQTQWDTYDRPRLYDGRVTIVGGEPVRFFAVRSMDDPEWKDAPEAEGVQTIDLAPYHFRTKRGKVLTAVREYAAAKGVTAREGGWVYDALGQPITQGWASYVHINVARLRKDRKVVAAVLAHHFGIKAPKQPRKPRTATRTIDGIKWVSKGDERWESEDGRYDIEHVHDFETECEVPHPVRITPAMAAEVRKAVATDYRPAVEHRYGREVVTAVEEGRRGYHCEGGQVHFYSQWVAGPTNVNSVVIIRSDTFTDAAQTVARFARGEIRAEG